MWPLWCAQPGCNEDTAASLFHRNFGLQEALEQLFGRKVFLNVWVKVKGGWADDARLIKQFGYE